MMERISNITNIVHWKTKWMINNYINNSIILILMKTVLNRFENYYYFSKFKLFDAIFNLSWKRNEEYNTSNANRYDNPSSNFKLNETFEIWTEPNTRKYFQPQITRYVFRFYSKSESLPLILTFRRIMETKKTVNTS